ncbi:MAG: helix-turn-helix domain-containing protein [Pseudomonadota bacterium]
MKHPRQAVAFDIPPMGPDGGKPEPALAECVTRAVRRYLLDRGEHEPDDLYQFVLREIEKPLLEVVFDYTDGNQSRCADILGMARGTVRKKLRDHGIL